jgi:hypothetical protein
MFRAAHRSSSGPPNFGIINSITKLHLVGISTESTVYIVKSLTRETFILTVPPIVRFWDPRMHFKR